MIRRTRRLAIGFSLAAVAAMTLATGSVQADQDRLWSELSEKAETLAISAPDFSRVAARVQPAVVSISVEQKAKVSNHQRRSRDPRMEDFFRFFGPLPEAPPVPREGLGTGFVIRKDGLILTNYHVVENADRIEVTLLEENGSERMLQAEVVGKAPEYDVALLRTTAPANAPVAYLGSSESVKIGEWAMAVGNPFGLSHSVSVGIISAKGRREIAPSGRAGVYNFLQTDASINPGNSGGPLVNMRGEVIGINTAINAAGQGIGFAIPIDMVKTMLPQLESTGTFARSWLGVHIQPVTEELAKSFGLRDARGALVSMVMKGSPAAKAGLKEGDVIRKFDGHLIQRSADLPVYAGMVGIGSDAELEVWRDGKRRRMSVTLGAFPGDDATAEKSDVDALGLMLGDSEEGPVVQRIARGSLAHRAGLRPGDVIVELDGQSIRSATALTGVIASKESGAVVRLRVLRDGAARFVAMRMP